MHVRLWKNCPVAWQGQFPGKEVCPTIVLEAFCDHNLWFWHAAFNFPGSLNDINIWGQSLLQRSFLDGTFSQLDFPFSVGGEEFRHLFAGGRNYPELARFVKSFQEPTGKNKIYFSKWQEGA